MTLLERLNDGGEVFLTHTTVGGQVVLRVAVGAPATTRADVERLWALLCENHDWLAADFAEIALQRERAEAERRAEVAREVAEREAAEREAAERDAAATVSETLEAPATQDETAAQADAQEELPLAP
jgi:aromatic-L-amino-acid decarboxylase